MKHQTLTTELFHDLLDPRLTAIEICMRHELAIDELAALVRSPEFTHAAQQLAEVENTRIAATAPLRHRLALRTLQTIAEQEPQSPTHTETVRKSAAQLARLSTPDRESVAELNAEPTTQSTPGRQAHADPQTNSNETPSQPQSPAETHPEPSSTHQNHSQHDHQSPSPADLTTQAGQTPSPQHHRKAG